MSDNKIKKGQSTWFGNFCSYWITNHNNAPIAITCDECAQETADKFVASYNACYGSGINPEAVGDLLKALKEVISVSDRKTDIYDRAKAAIEKATIIR